METSSSIAANTANATPASNNTERDTNRNIRLALENMQENSNLNLKNYAYALFQDYENSLFDSSCLYVCPFVRMEQSAATGRIFLKFVISVFFGSM
jgi:hypothetical protein